MNILHLLSQLQPTGSEFYAADLADRQIADGHNVIIVSDTLTAKTQAKYIRMNVSQRGLFHVLNRKAELRRILDKHQIDVIHSHSRASGKVATMAVQGTKIPHISTVHGRQHIHYSSTHSDPYGDRTIAVCENIQEHLVNDLKIREDKIVTIRNPFDYSKFDEYFSSLPVTPVLSIIGRTTSFKGERTGEIIEHCFEQLLRENGDLKIQIVGGDVACLPQYARDVLKGLNDRFPNRILYRGFVANTKLEICYSSAIIGSGRVAVESIAHGIPTIALGECEYIGLVNSNNLDRALQSNFGDSSATQCGSKVVDIDNVMADVRMAINMPRQEKVAQDIRKYFDIEEINNKISNIYREEMIRKAAPKYIPTLLYHQVLDQPAESIHKIFIESSAFEKQLKSIKKRGIETITFSEYEKYRNGELDARKFPKKPIVLTFDDGYADNEEIMLPLLSRYSMKAVVFVLGDRSIRENTWDVAHGEKPFPLMSHEQIKRLIENGIEIGAHSMTHKPLCSLSDEELYQQIVESKHSLEKEFGIEVVSFSYPWGEWDERVRSLVIQAGYKYAVATDSGGMTWEDDRWAIFRPNIFSSTNWFSFLKKSSPFYRKRFFRKHGR